MWNAANTLQGNAYVDVSFLRDFTFSLKGNISLRNIEDSQYGNAEIGAYKDTGFISKIDQEYKEYTLLQIVTGLLPDFRIIAWLLQFYIVYVVWEGVPVLMGVEEKQRLKYTLLSSVLLILCPAVIQIVFNRLTAILN